jgi:curli biogenesis system outer membrane secretion channel CsgG
MKIRVCFLLLLCLSYGIALAAQDTKPRIAIKTFENPVAYQNSTIGNALTEILTTELGKTGKYRLVEREAVAELMKEIGFGSTEWSKSPTFAQKGGFKGADYFLLGKVTNFGFKEESIREQVTTNRGAEWVTTYEQQADVRVDFRVVSTTTGEAVLTEAGSAHRTNRSYASEIAAWNRFIASGSFATAEFSSSLIGRATVDAVRNVVRKLSDLSSELRRYSSEESLASNVEQLGEAEGKILAEVGPEQYVVSLGMGNGLVKGDRLKVYSEVLTKNKNGEVIYREQKEGGVLEVIDVSMKDRAKARFLGSGQAAEPRGVPPREGDLVKIDVEYARKMRGSAEGGSGANPGDVGRLGGSTGNAADYQTFRKKGDRFLEDEYYSQALEQYQKALALKPNDPELLDRVASAHLFLKDFAEAETLAEKILGQGAPLTIPRVGHQHFSGQCVGELVIQKGQLSFRTKTGQHDFKLAPADIVEIRQAIMPQNIVLRWRGPDGKEKKYDLLMPVKKDPLTGRPEIDAQGMKDAIKATRIVLRLVQEYVK